MLDKRKQLLLEIWNSLIIMLHLPYLLISIMINWEEVIADLVLILPSMCSLYFGVIKHNIKIAAYSIIVPLPICITLVTWYIGTETHILVVFVQICLFVPFFFDNRYQVLGLSLYILSLAIVSHFAKYSPFLISDTINHYNTDFIAIMNIVSTICCITIFVFYLNQENIKFEKHIVSQNKIIKENLNELEKKSKIIELMLRRH